MACRKRTQPWFKGEGNSESNLHPPTRKWEVLHISSDAPYESLASHSISWKAESAGSDQDRPILDRIGWPIQADSSDSGRFCLGIGRIGSGSGLGDPDPISILPSMFDFPRVTMCLQLHRTMARAREEQSQGLDDPGQEIDGKLVAAKIMSWRQHRMSLTHLDDKDLTAKFFCSSQKNVEHIHHRYSTA
ncbi:hypothetical protein Taro_052214 [Colocasia esculenta]|uniref:Uncharacterized protein n=1 Tax=Colocasia esculenta TaxID=4460 RepID=A0A843XI07_COLES|nr:hypothetical protein [Colocasia esculenta]